MGFDIDKLGKAAEENKKKKATKPVGKEVATAYYGRTSRRRLLTYSRVTTISESNFPAYKRSLLPVKRRMRILTTTRGA